MAPRCLPGVAGLESRTEVRPRCKCSGCRVQSPQQRCCAPGRTRARAKGRVSEGPGVGGRAGVTGGPQGHAGVSRGQARWGRGRAGGVLGPSLQGAGTLRAWEGALTLGPARGQGRCAGSSGSRDSSRPVAQAGDSGLPRPTWHLGTPQLSRPWPSPPPAESLVSLSTVSWTFLFRRERLLTPPDLTGYRGRRPAVGGRVNLSMREFPPWWWNTADPEPLSEHPQTTFNPYLHLILSREESFAV